MRVSVPTNLSLQYSEAGARRVIYWLDAWIVTYAALGLLAIAFGARYLMALWQHFRRVALCRPARPPRLFRIAEVQQSP